MTNQLANGRHHPRDIIQTNRGKESLGKLGDLIDKLYKLLFSREQNWYKFATQIVGADGEPLNLLLFDRCQGKATKYLAKGGPWGPHGLRRWQGGRSDEVTGGRQPNGQLNRNKVCAVCHRERRCEALLATGAGGAGDLSKSSEGGGRRHRATLI